MLPSFFTNFTVQYLEFPDESTGNFPHLVEEVSSTPRPAFFPQIFPFTFGALPLLGRMLLLSSHVLDLVNTYDLSMYNNSKHDKQDKKEY